METVIVEKSVIVYKGDLPLTVHMIHYSNSVPCNRGHTVETFTSDVAAAMPPTWVRLLGLAAHLSNPVAVAITAVADAVDDFVP